jgi:hypothetical protein
VLAIGSTIYVGESTRTNAEGDSTVGGARISLSISEGIRVPAPQECGESSGGGRNSPELGMGGLVLFSGSAEARRTSRRAIRRECTMDWRYRHLLGELRVKRGNAWSKTAST